MLDKLVWSLFISISDQSSLKISKHDPIYFSCLGECSNTVLLWSSRNVSVEYETPRDFPRARVWENDDWLSIFGGNFSFNWWLKQPNKVVEQKNKVMPQNCIYVQWEIFLLPTWERPPPGSDTAKFCSLKRFCLFFIVCRSRCLKLLQ